MDQDMIKIIMNPVRLRIVQYLMIHENGTASQIRDELSDIPPASLYRHLKTLYEADCLIVVEEKRIRGAVEKTYALNQNPVGEFNRDSAGQMIQSALMSLMASFQKYFADEASDPVKDLLVLSTSTLLLSEEEFKIVMDKMGEALTPYICNKPEEGRKARRFTFISSPCEED